MVDVSYISGKSVEVLEYQTQVDCPQKIVSTKCNHHISDTSATKASETSGHNNNLNTGFDESLSKLHSTLVCMKRLGMCMKVYDDVQN